MNNKKILFVLLGLFIIFLAYRITHPFKQETVSSLKYTGKSPGTGDGASAKGSNKNSHELSLYLPLLSGQIKPSDKIYKNIFYNQGPVSSIKRPPPELIEPPIKIVERNPAEKVREDFKRFRMFGFSDENGQTAVFFKNGNLVLIVNKGDLINGKYKVENISKESVTLKAQNIDDLVHINLNFF